MSSDDSRRAFLRKTTSWATALSLAPFLGSCEGCFERIRNRPIRKSLATLPDNDPIIETYRDAVAAMKALPSTDGRSWLRQAQIHFDHCPHGNWWFLPWHRAYLSYFEQICRDLTGNDDFALPYWDWTADAHVPAPFWGTSSNALFRAGRSATQTSTASATFVGRPVIDDILDETDFLLFGSGVAATQRQASTYGALEATPHNNVHGFVGGIMGGYQSPQDPIFWMHHNMIECLWVEWNVVRHNANTNDPAWSNLNFASNFFDTSGSPVDITVGATLLMPLLSYQFDGACGGPDGSARMTRALADTVGLREFLRRGGPPRVDLLQRFEVAQGFELTTRAPVSTRIPLPPEALSAVTGAAGSERLLFRVEQIVPPRTNSFFVRVYVNLPSATPATPTEDPHYAGSFAFFNDPAHQIDASAGGGAFIVDITDTVRRLNQAGQLAAGAPVDLQLVAVPMHAESPQAETFSARRVALQLARVRAQESPAR